MREFSVEHKETWLWTMMIAQPGQVTAALFERTRAQVRRKKDSPTLAKLRLEEFHEGLAAQIMHLGPYAAEAPTIARLHAFIRQQGYTFSPHTAQKPFTDGIGSRGMIRGCEHLRSHLPDIVGWRTTDSKP